MSKHDDINARNAALYGDPVEAERRHRIDDTIGQCERVIAVLRRVRKKEPIEDMDRRLVARLIRVLVEEWV